MLARAGLSLFLGGAATCVALWLYFLGAAPEDPPTRLKLDPADARLEAGSVASSPGQGLRLRLDSRGEGILAWAVPAIDVGQYPLLRCDLAAADTPGGSLRVSFWKGDSTGQRQLYTPMATQPGRVAWQPMVSAQGLDTVVELGLLIQGPPGQAVDVAGLQLLPATAGNRFRLLFADLRTPGSWNLTSINGYRGVEIDPGLSPYPVPLAAGWVALSLLFYYFLRRSAPPGGRDWWAPAAIFLAGWLCLDLLWQYRLYDRLEHTRERFAGLDPGEKRRAGPDAALAQFIDRLQPRLQAVDARIFVSSADDYAGMRAAYFVYPGNVYWQRKGPELPPRRFLKPGDLILVVAPTAIRFDQQRRRLETPGGERVAVQLLDSGPQGGLFRVL